MLRLSEQQASDLADAVLSARELPRLATAIESLYARVQQEIDQRKPVCIVSGKCCHFEAYGHRLFVTTAELAVFKSRLTKEAPQHDVSAGGCSYQEQKLCGVHSIRPFGCRMFFCDPTTTDWQHERYERFHAELRALHVAFDLPYFYVEWREALRALKLM